MAGRTGKQVRDCRWMTLLEVTVAVFILEFSRCYLNVITGPMMINEDDVPSFVTTKWTTRLYRPDRNSMQQTN